MAQRDEAPAYLVICAHGADDGFAFGDYGPSIDTTMLVNGCLSPRSLDGRIALPGSIVVSTACGTGSEAFGAVFLAGRVAAYVAPRGSPDGAEAALFVHRLFHALLRTKAALEHALDVASQSDATFVGFFRLS